MVPIEIRSASVRFRAPVGAEGIEQALNLTRACYLGDEVGVVFPIEPETFFVREGAASPRGQPAGGVGGHRKGFGR